MRTIGVVTVVVLIIIFYIYSVKKSFTVKPHLDDINVNDLNSFGEGKTFISLRLQLIIKFFAFFNISFSNLRLQIYSNKILVAKSSDVAENFKPITLIRDIDNIVYYNFDVFISKETFDLLYKMKMKEPFQFQFYLTARILGITVNYNGTYKK